MKQKKKYYDGKRKVLYKTDDSSLLIQFFKDSFYSHSKSCYVDIHGKGVVNNSISAYLMERLDANGISTHLIDKLNMREQLIKHLEVVPVQLRITNMSHDRYANKFGIERGYVFNTPMIDFLMTGIDRTKIEINERHICQCIGFSKEELEAMVNQGIRINDFISGIFAHASMRLVECKLKFGRVFNEEEFGFMLCDEISLDNCVLLDMRSNTSMNLIDVNDCSTDVKVYQNVLNRLTSTTHH